MGRTVVCDIETDSLTPTKIWCIVAKDVNTDEDFTFERVTENPERFLDFCSTVDVWVGHNFIGFDYLAINSLIREVIDPGNIVDTLVVSKLLNFNRPGGHSLEDYGRQYGIPKIGHDEWDKYSPEMLERCRRDVLINLRLYREQLPYITSPEWADAMRVEHFMASICNILHSNGFRFNIEKAKELYITINNKLKDIDNELQRIFPPKLISLKEVLPKSTSKGTLHKGDFRWVTDGDLTPYSSGAAFTLCKWQTFNPGSTKQRIDRLWEAGWRPINKTEGHKDFLRLRPKDRPEGKTEYFSKYGWTCDEENLSTLPESAPVAIKTLVQRLLLAGRTSRLEEWINAYSAVSGRIHGTFYPIGAWTHRMAHASPNMGNVPKFNDKDPEKTPYSDEMRALWCVPEDRYLIGVDAESIQLRIFGHYIDEPEFTKSLLEGRKEDGTDPHSVNQRAIGRVCKSRDAAKNFIYAFLLGVGVDKAASILDCTRAGAKEARDRFIERYPGLKFLKEKVIPNDAALGYFRGFDGRYVRCKGKDQSEREHYMLGGYLQNGESTIMKRGVELWYPRLVKEGIPFKFVNFVHDEWQVEAPRDMEIAKYVAEVMANSIRAVGTDLNLRCPMAGSVLNSHGKLAIGDNWMETH